MDMYKRSKKTNGGLVNVLLPRIWWDHSTPLQYRANNTQIYDNITMFVINVHFIYYCQQTPDFSRTNLINYCTNTNQTQQISQYQQYQDALYESILDDCESKKVKPKKLNNVMGILNYL